MTKWCMPWWHNQLTQWATDRRLVTDCKVQDSASAEFPLAGFVPCPPDQLRVAAEKSMRLMNVWPKDKPLPLAVYSLARNIASDADKGSIEERVVVGEITLNESARLKTDPTALLLMNKIKLSYYGAADQGRFASTHQDPTVGHVLIAAFILAGQTDNFSRGTTAYIKPNTINNDTRLIAFLGEKFASNKWGWVGHFPNVNIRHLFGLIPMTDASVDQMTTNQQGLADLRTNTNPPAPQTTCPGPGDKKPINWKNVGTIAAVAVIASLLAAGTSYAVAESHTKRWKDWEPEEPPEAVPEPDLTKPSPPSAS